MKHFWICILLITFISCSSDSTTNNEIDDDPEQIEEVDTFDPDADYQLLFVGNSLTIENNLPLLVKNRGEALGVSISCTAQVGAGYGLEDHWNIGAVQSMISSEFYDYVIIQQGPSSQAYGRASLIEYGGYMADLCENIDTELAYFMVWPAIANFDTFDAVIDNYTDAANLNNAISCNVGQIWKHHIDGSNDYSYYGTDGFHPSVTGSELAAQIIVQKLGLQ